MRLISLLALMVGAVTCTATPAVAGSAGAGNIYGLIIANNGVVLFNTSGARVEKPACVGPNLDMRWAIDASTPAGQAQLAMLLNAYNTHKKIAVGGTHTCSAWSDTETVSIFWVQDT
jgi:hypothetical protein